MGFAFQRGEPALALLLALGFVCLLRTAEMLALTHHHVVFHPGRRSLSVIFPGSKTSHGNPQVWVVDDGDLVALALTIVRPRSKSLLWPQGPIVSNTPSGFFFKMQALMPLTTPLIAYEDGALLLVAAHLVHGLCSFEGQVAMSKDSKNLCGRRVYAAGPCDLDPGPASASQARPFSLFPSTASPAPKQKWILVRAGNFNFSCFLKWVVVTLESSVISLREGLMQFHAHYASQRL